MGGLRVSINSFHLDNKYIIKYYLFNYFNINENNFMFYHIISTNFISWFVGITFNLMSYGLDLWSLFWYLDNLIITDYIYVIYKHVDAVLKTLIFNILRVLRKKKLYNGQLIL